MKPFARVTFNPVVEVAESTGNGFQAMDCTGFCAAVRTKRAMWWRFMKPRHLDGVDGPILRSER